MMSDECRKTSNIEHPTPNLEPLNLEPRTLNLERRTRVTATLTQGMQKVECRMQKFGSKAARGYPEATLRPSGGQPVGTPKPP